MGREAEKDEDEVDFELRFAKRDMVVCSFKWFGRDWVGLRRFVSRDRRDGGKCAGLREGVLFA
jgi:hypothetical protein